MKMDAQEIPTNKVNGNLQVALSHFAAIIESSDDAIISKDLQGIVTSWNPSATRIFGYSADEMIGQPMLRLFPPDRLSEEAEILKNIIAGLKVDHFETVRVRKDGRLINISATISPIRDASGTIVGASKVARDITDKHRYEAIFALSPDGFVTFDRQHLISHASQAVETLTGIPTSALIGQSLSTFVSLLNAGSRDGSQLSGTERLLDMAHSRLPLNLHRHALDKNLPQVLSLQARSTDKGLVSLVVSLRDISYESHVERLKSEFMTTAAHELRTPMTSIRGFIELLTLKEDSLQSPQRQQLLAVIHKQALLINTILDDLLDLNKLESRMDSDFQVAPLEMVGLVQEVLTGWPTPADRRSPTLRADAPPLWIEGDGNYLRRALMNLLSNAFKYSTGLSPIEITVGIDPQDPAQLCLSIRDEGRGMTKEQLARYGERFYRADESGTVPGSGLGVSIVKQIVALHGGRFDVQSTLHEGTRVTIRLPLLTPTSALPS